MSIFKKITFLFLVSLSLMLVIGYQVDKINTQRVEALVTQKYLQDAKKVFRWLATSSPNKFENRLHTLNLTLLKVSTKNMDIVLAQTHSFGEVKILKTSKGEYLLYVSYMDDTVVLNDIKLQESLQEQWILNILVLLDILVLIIIFLVILKILSPLKQIIARMQEFSLGNYQSRAEVESNDEIAEVAKTYNLMAQKLQDHIVSREEFLRDISHELRTPIAKGLFAVETLSPSSSKDIIHKSFSELERLSSELLEIEKLHAMDNLHKENFKVETLILESLSKLILENESQIKIEISQNFTIFADLNYLSLALKNLIDNAIKYALVYPITIKAEDKKISIINSAQKLDEDLAYYLQAFTRQESARKSEGYGLGLNIVKKVLDKHKFTLEYEYLEGKHIFSIGHL